MRVLITGATGFVGRHMVRECVRRHDEVIGTHYPGDQLPPADVPTLPLDLLDDASVTAALEEAGPEAVVHLAGQANVQQAGRDPCGTFRVNAEGTYRLLAALKKIAPRARTVVITSSEVYGQVSHEELPVREEQPIRPRSPYGAAKAAADVCAGQAALGWGLWVIRARPFNQLGPGQRCGFVVPDFASRVAAIEKGEADPVMRVGNLSPRRDFTDVRDVVRGYRLALESGAAGRAYNFCSGTATAIQEILGFFVDRARAHVEVTEDPALLREVDVPEVRGDAARAREELGWEPRIPLAQSLEEVLQEWRDAAPGAAPPVD